MGQAETENEKDERGRHPVEATNWLSFSTFYWMGSLMSLAYRQGLTEEDVPEIPTKEGCNRNANSLEELWAREVASASRPSFGRVAWKYCRSRVIITSMFYITSLVLGFLTPTILMKKVMSFAREPEVKIYDALTWVSLLLLCELGRVFFITLTWAMSYRTAMRLRTGCMGLVYRKLLRIGNVTDKVSSKIINVISGDCNRLHEILVSGQVALGGPIVLGMCSVYIWYELGWLPMLGLIVFVLAYPLQYLLAKGSGSMKRKAARVKDDRISLVSQAIQHFKFLKMFGWESYLFETITDVREKERKYIVKGQLLQSFSTVLGPTLPHIAVILTFLIYISSGNELRPEQAFCILTLYASRLRPVLARTRSAFRAWFEAKVSASRIQAFTTLFVFSLLFFSIRMLTQLYDSLYSFRVCSERMKSLLVIPEMERIAPPSDCEDFAIIISDLNVIRRSIDLRQDETKQMNSIERLLGNSGSESDSLSFQLGPISLEVKKGGFIGICGYVGSGKTTLLETIAGSMLRDSGTLKVCGSLAYVPQHPWLFKGTLRDNIVFGEPFNSVRYYNCVDSCCLTNDFGVLPLADLTLVENNGMNLSGGQKQRISLARALYYPSADIYLLDDPLSGLDNQVAKQVFENAIISKLRNQKKTILFVTHQLHYLKECDEIIVMSDGNVVQRGTHEQLIEAQESIYNGLWATSANFPSDNESILMEDSQMLDIQTEPSAVNTAKKLQLELEKSRKDVEAEVYFLYIKSAGGWITFLFVILAFTLSSGSTSFSSWWLKQWFRGPSDPVTLSENGTVTVENGTVIEGTAPTLNATGVAGVELETKSEFISMDSLDFVWNRNVYLFLIGVIFATSLYRTIYFVMATMRASKNLHRGILRQFFSNRMKTLEKLGTGQIYNLFARDMDEVDGSLPNNIESFLQNVFIVFTVLGVVTGIFPWFLVFAAVVFLVFAYYRKIYNIALRDLKRIESKRRSPIFGRISESVKGLATIRAFNKEGLMIKEFEKLTDSLCTVTYTFNSSVRWLSIRLDALAVMITGAVATLVFIFHGAISASAAGLALAYGAQLSGVFQFTVRLASETEAKFVSVERMQTFLSHEFTEDLEISPRGVGFPEKGEYVNDMHPNWPTSGHVKFSSVTLSYSSDSPILREVSFEVEPGTNVGIIGRTGSGKSSIGNALFRLTELKSGQILIDGVDISKIPLRKLRNSMTVIPQDPSVFHKSIRFNLDAGGLYKDHELWAVLEKTGLKSCVDNLDYEVGLSHGQKQLLCIARALLRQSKIVFVDEATSNMDIETAAIVERLIASEFKYSTVFIVAHRMSALASCDNILIMGDGEVKDFGPADVLSKKPEFKQSFEKFESVELE